MNKPLPKIRRIYNFREMCDYIEDKYKCNLRDYAAHKNGCTSTIGYNIKYQEEWKRKYYPKLVDLQKNPLRGYGLNQAGMDFANTKEGKVWFDDMCIAYRNHPDGVSKELPYWDFWHFLLDNYSINNGAVMEIYFDELKDCCQEDWQKEICELFDKEFGTVEIDFSW